MPCFELESPAASLFETAQATARAITAFSTAARPQLEPELHVGNVHRLALHLLGLALRIALLVFLTLHDLDGGCRALLCRAAAGLFIAPALPPSLPPSLPSRTLPAAQLITASLVPAASCSHPAKHLPRMGCWAD